MLTFVTSPVSIQDFRSSRHFCPVQSSAFRGNTLNSSVRKSKAFYYVPKCTAVIAPNQSSPDPAEHKTSTRKVGKIIVPGKFDAFHLGHRQLASVAAEIGEPTFLSFSGMALSLGWRPRAPVVATVERNRILRNWSASIGKTIGWRMISFADVSYQTPAEFVDYMCEELGAVGVVCGTDWKFGRGASGNVDTLKELSRGRLDVRVVPPVEYEHGIVSSTRIREALANGDIEEANQLLGRNHRLVGTVDSVGDGFVRCGQFVNMVPGDGVYEGVIRVLGRSDPIHSEVEIKWHPGINPMTPVEVGSLDLVEVSVKDAENIYCADCEVNIDFIQRIK